MNHDNNPHVTVRLRPSQWEAIASFLEAYHASNTTELAAEIRLQATGGR